MERATKIFLIYLICIGITSFVVSDTLGGGTQDQTLTYYNFPLNVDSCDMHWVRMRVQYECNILPNALSYIRPEISIGFIKPLLPEQLTCLNRVMVLPDICTEPAGIKCRAYIDVTPDNFQTSMTTATGERVMYYSNGTRVYVLFFNDLNAGAIDDVSNQLKDMWTIQC